MYTPDDYNSDNVLKIPIILYVTVVYAVKYYIYIASILAGAKRSTALKGYAMGMDANIMLLIVTLPAIFVIVSMVKRGGESGNIFRVIWRFGRYLLSSTLAFNAILFAFIAYTTPYGKNNYLYVFSFFDMWFLVYLNTTQRLKDVFNEFPASKK